MFGSSRIFALAGALAVSLGVVPTADAAYQDPPGRVARLSDHLGEISFSPVGENAWFDLARNRPLIGGDRIWADRNARAEFQLGGAVLRLGADTGVEILDLDDRITQLRMTQGTLNVRIRHLYPDQVFEVDTPMLAFVIEQAGRYRIDVDARSGRTTIVVWDGAGQAWGDDSYFPLRAGDRVRFYQSDLNDHDRYGLPHADAFDRYCLDRDYRLDRSLSLRYLDDDIIGYADLDDYGSWRSVSGYGNVWFPNRIDAGWAPYRHGHWIWQDPWGWTWIDDAPWGFAPSHYGRWVHVSRRWGWVPGPRQVRHVYAPALVAFIGGRGWSVSLSLGGGALIGWFPLAPHEVYVPAYRSSRDYFGRVNASNTVISNTIISNVFNHYATGNIHVTQANYTHRTLMDAVTAVPGTVFVNSQPIRPAARRLDRNVLASGEVTRVAPIAPTARSVLGPGMTARARPSAEATRRQVLARHAPAPRGLPFAAREQQLRQSPGQSPATAVPSPAASRAALRNVRVIDAPRNAVNARQTRSRRDTGIPAADADRMAPSPPPRQPPAVEPQRDERERQVPAPQPPAQPSPTPSPQQQIQQAQATERQRAVHPQRAAERQRSEHTRRASLSPPLLQQQATPLPPQQAQPPHETGIQGRPTEAQQEAERKRQAAEQERLDRESRVPPQQPPKPRRLPPQIPPR